MRKQMGNTINNSMLIVIVLNFQTNLNYFKFAKPLPRLSLVLMPALSSHTVSFAF